MADLAYAQLGRRHAYLLAGSGGAVVGATRTVAPQDIKPDATEHGPSAAQQNPQPGDETNARHGHHDDQKSGAAEGTMWSHHGREESRFGLGELVTGAIASPHGDSL